MANSPIQVVLNSSDFISIWDRDGGGEQKDFFANRDDEFIAHKEKLNDQLSNLKRIQIENEFSTISFAKLILRQSALAKSHRPTTSLFNRNVAPVVGAGDLGELYVELRSDSVNKLTKKISEAETQTKWKERKDTGKLVPNPSTLRSEVGAIEEILPYTASDKRKFSVNEGLEWIKNPLTGGAYIVELFETPPPRQNWDNLNAGKFQLFKTFVDGLESLGQGVVVYRLTNSAASISMLGIRLEESDSLPNIQLIPVQSTARKNVEAKSVSASRSKHAKLLDFLDKHPLVRKVLLPPIITKSNTVVAKASAGTKFEIPKPKTNKSYPIIGIIDGGVSEVFVDWVEDVWGLLGKGDKDVNHGTFIAGLIVAGKMHNGHKVCNELDGCRIIDLDILPRAESFQSYFTKPLEFFTELEYAVKELKSRTGVRIFNFSLNIEEHVSSGGYSPYAKILDKIAEENDIIFVISVGNTKKNDFRKEWPQDPLQALTILATSQNDTIQQPSESSRNLSISALNPPDLSGIVPFAPSNYSRRGPGIRVGLKPDLAHVGGAGTRVSGKGHGLYSCDSKGNLVDGCGTSYAAPHVSKTLASIDHAIDGEVSRESLIGMTIHHASLPDILNDKKLRDVAKHLVGFGIPECSNSILEGADHSITLVFANRVYPGRKMSFAFNWPPSLVVGGKCTGYSRLTIVSTPPFDYRFGAEFVRINVEGYLRQEQKDGNFLGRLDPVYLPNSADAKLFEKEQIEHSFKWSPIKVFEKTFPRGVGPSTNWRLEIEYLERDGEKVPMDGVPFTALLTISDINKKAPVFNEMRQMLQSTGVNIMDIKTAARVIPRV